MSMITTPEAARELGMTTRGVLVAIKAGRLKAKQYGRSWLVDSDSLEPLRVQVGRGRPRGPVHKSAD